MPDIVQIAIKTCAKLRGYDDYLENELARSHKDKVQINGIESWNGAPTINYSEWVQLQHEKMLSHKKRGRPISWGTWYMLTFPDRSWLDDDEKPFYLLQMIGALDTGSCGKAAWHDKFLLGAHDLNLLVSPVALHGPLALPRRDREICEFRRLQLVSDRAVEEMNRRRQALQRKPIQTMTEVQARERKSKKRKTVAETLAESSLFKALLADEKKGKRRTIEAWRSQLIKVLEDAENVVKHWDFCSWEASVVRPGLRAPQKFHMLMIVSEAVELLYHPKQELAKDREANKGSSEIAPVHKQGIMHALNQTRTEKEVRIDATENVLPMAAIFRVLTHRPNLRMPLKSRKDLTNRLLAGNLKAKLGPNDEFKITDAQGCSLLIPGSHLMLAAQTRILWERLYESSTVHSNAEVYLDLTPLGREVAPGGLSTDREFRLPETGPIWGEALEIVKDTNVRQKWEPVLVKSATIKDVSQRVMMIRKEMDGAGVDSWTQFILLLAHASNAPTIVSTHLLPVIQESSHFKHQLVVEMLSAARATESQEQSRSQ